MLSARLQARSAEIVEAIIARIDEIAPAVRVELEGAAIRGVGVEAIVDVIAAVIEQGEDWEPRLPPAAVAHLRFVAGLGVTWDAVMRGYHAVINVLLETLTEEVASLPPAALPYLIGMQSLHSDALVSAIAAEYEQEVARLDRSPAKRTAECVERLLADKACDMTDLDYDIEAWHLGAIAVGPRAGLVTRGLAERLGCRLLLVPRGAEVVWIWLGAKQATPFSRLEQVIDSGFGKSVRLAVGESRSGLEGWRLTHREAQVALTVMLRQPDRLVRGSDVALLAAAIENETLRKSLVDAYLGSLGERNDARVLRDTLRVYFSVDCNAASAAAMLDVNRHTVQRRLHRVEQALGRSLDTCRAEMDVALRIEQIELGQE